MRRWTAPDGTWFWWKTSISYSLPRRSLDGRSDIVLGSRIGALVGSGLLACRQASARRSGNGANCPENGKGYFARYG